MNRRIVNVYAFLLGLTLAAALCFSSAAKADGYAWSNTGGYHGGGTFTVEYVPEAALQAFCSHIAWFDGSEWRNVVPGAIASNDGLTIIGSCTGEIYEPGTASWNQSTFGGRTVATRVSTPCAVHGLVLENGKCMKPNPCTPLVGNIASSGMYDLGTDSAATPPTVTCDGQCELSYNGSGVVARQMISGVYHYFSEGSYSVTNTKCYAATGIDSVTSLPPISCDPVTQQQGEVNGHVVCLNKTIDSDSNTTKTTTTAGDVTTDTETTVTNNADGTITTTTATTATNNVTGEVTSSTDSSTTRPVDDTWCALNPADPACSKNDIPWGTVPGPESLGVLNIPVNTSYSVVGGEGSCPADASLDVMGIPITWSYQPICNFASTVRPILIAFAWVSFGFIVLGAVRS